MVGDGVDWSQIVDQLVEQRNKKATQFQVAGDIMPAAMDQERGGWRPGIGQDRLGMANVGSNV